MTSLDLPRRCVSCHACALQGSIHLHLGCGIGRSASRILVNYAGFWCTGCHVCQTLAIRASGVLQKQSEQWFRLLSNITYCPHNHKAYTQGAWLSTPVNNATQCAGQGLRRRHGRMVQTSKQTMYSNDLQSLSSSHCVCSKPGTTQRGSCMHKTHRWR